MELIGPEYTYNSPSWYPLLGGGLTLNPKPCPYNLNRRCEMCAGYVFDRYRDWLVEQQRAPDKVSLGNQRQVIRAYGLGCRASKPRTLNPVYPHQPPVSIAFSASKSCTPSYFYFPLYFPFCFLLVSPATV